MERLSFARHSLGALVGGEAIISAAARAQLDGLLAIWQPPLTD